MEDQVKGTIQDVAGKVMGAVGDITDDAELKTRGKARELAGRAQQTYGQALDSFREAAEDNPALTLAVVAGVGFLLGAMWSRRE